MEQKRKYQRFPVALSATLFGAGNAPGMRCDITEVSRAGLIIELETKELPRAGQNLMLEIQVPGTGHPVNALVKLKWIKPLSPKKNAKAAVGAQITIMKPDDKKALLDHACDQLLRAERET
jgi:hypothetical protein